MASNCWLQGKTVIVTGASGGMGAGIAATLIKKHGCTVIGVARSEPKMQKFIDELGEEYREQFGKLGKIRTGITEKRRQARCSY